MTYGRSRGRFSRPRTARGGDQADGELVDLDLQFLVARRIALARLGEHHHALGAADRVGRAKHGDAAAAHAREIAHRFFELVRADVASAADDDVLLAPGAIEAALDRRRTTARVHPVPLEPPLGRLGVAVVAAGGRRPAELKQSLAAV